MITVDKLQSVKATIDRLIEHSGALYSDISETAEDRARLLTEADERERTIEKLNREADQAARMINDLELRNNQLVEDVVRLETSLSEATARLDAIREHANGAVKSREPPRPNGPDLSNLAQLRRPSQGLLPAAEKRE